MTPLYSEPIPVTEITSDWRKFHFPRDSRVITCVNLNLDLHPAPCIARPPLLVCITSGLKMRGIKSDGR